MVVHKVGSHRRAQRAVAFFWTDSGGGLVTVRVMAEMLALGFGFDFFFSAPFLLTRFCKLLGWFLVHS